jgi:hypothetical protein
MNNLDEIVPDDDIAPSVATESTPLFLKDDEDEPVRFFK